MSKSSLPKSTRCTGFCKTGWRKRLARRRGRLCESATKDGGEEFSRAQDTEGLGSGRHELRAGQTGELPATRLSECRASRCFVFFWGGIPSRLAEACES